MTEAADLPDWMQERRAADVLELAPDEASAFALFAALGTQWRHHAMTGIRMGLDYTAIPATAAMMAIDMTPGLLVDLRVMEHEALAVFAERSARS